jgi:hypothetical protein
MKLNKYTKAELISKLNKIKNENIENNGNYINKLNSYLSMIWVFLIKFKSMLLKLTLISFLIRIFKKYRLFRRIWIILNSIIVTIFGISLIDNFGFDFIQHFFREIKFIISNTVDYLTNTHFYQYINKLFESNENPSSKTTFKSKSISENSIEKTRNDQNFGQSNRDSKISEWLKQEPEEKLDDIKESNNKYYYYIIALIVISALSWYYFDEIKTTGSSILEWIRSFQSGGDNNPDNNMGDIRDLRREKRLELENLVKGKTKETEEKLDNLIDKSKGKNVRIMSPSLEDLNKTVQESWDVSSPTSSISSDETIKASSSNLSETSSHVKSESPFPLENSFLENNISNKTLLNLTSNWRNVIKPELKDSIEYIEKHLPKSDLDDTTYITQLLEEINRKSTIYLNDLEVNKNKIQSSDLVYFTEISKNLDKWIEEMRSEISKFE